MFDKKGAFIKYKWETKSKLLQYCKLYYGNHLTFLWRRPRQICQDPITSQICLLLWKSILSWHNSHLKPGLECFSTLKTLLGCVMASRILETLVSGTYVFGPDFTSFGLKTCKHGTFYHSYFTTVFLVLIHFNYFAFTLSKNIINEKSQKYLKVNVLQSCEFQMCFKTKQ